MTNKETVNRNIGLTFDFLKQIAKDPTLIDKVPDGSTLEFIDKDFATVEKKSTSRLKRKYLKVKSQIEII